MLLLHGSVPLEVRHGDAFADFELRAGEHADFVMELDDGVADSPCGRDDYASDAFERTLDFWRSWIGRSTYDGRWREVVNRSALTLKLLCSQEHGSSVAAATFGLPEILCGERNWDYRYAWIRDTSFTLRALLELGFTEEARAFMGWVEARCAERDEEGLHTLYAIDGGTDVDERELDHLGGYHGSRPVRIGNQAHRQLQLDIYGELLESIDLWCLRGRRGSGRPRGSGARASPRRAARRSSAASRATADRWG